MQDGDIRRRSKVWRETHKLTQILWSAQVNCVSGLQSWKPGSCGREFMSRLANNSGRQCKKIAYRCTSGSMVERELVVG